MPGVIVIVRVALFPMAVQAGENVRVGNSVGVVVDDDRTNHAEARITRGSRPTRLRGITPQVDAASALVSCISRAT